MRLKSIKIYLSQEKRSIGVGIGVYFISLFAVIGSVLFFFRIFEILPIGRSLFLLFIFMGLLSIPAILSSLTACYLSRKRYIGIFTVLIIISFFSFFWFPLLLGIILGPPPDNIYEEFTRGLAIAFMRSHVVISVISAISATITEYFFFHFHPISNS